MKNLVKRIYSLVPKKITKHSLPLEPISQINQFSNPQFAPYQSDEANIFKIKNTNHANYIIEKIQIYQPFNGKEHSIYIIDIKNNSKLIGYAKIILNLTDPRPKYKNKPFISFNSTQKKFQRQGYATNRIILMNLLSSSFFNYPLYSGNLISGPEIALWEKLTKNDIAKKYIESQKQRYAFKEKAKPFKK